ncbi:hypothetical protein H7I53_17805 [Mycolicibacterium pulveris]|uniref:CDGP domain-containing protein n=1 Tax=Mycolicibacterium pulveris TaxID=36813 RepID=A0A7I7UCB9_MYCPV|nr:hypothetical protein [Mycolicibacterium pulveris]MCV6982073.1 hypothetical protein [Mycolicibacterium pulveris]BBY78887.1 hypothetical protein MPUL_00450 [Mycolicibacterium pulveris]
MSAGVQMMRLLAVLVLAVAAVGVGTAAPAAAGCQVQPFVTWCDGPIQPDGSWQRCWQNPPSIVNNGAGGGIVINGGQQCNTVLPGQPLDGWGQPPHYIP